MLIPEAMYRRIQRQVLAEKFDADETAFLDRELVQVRAKILEVEYPELKGRRFFPNATDIAPTAEKYTYKVIDKVGRARVSANATDNSPRVEVNASERDGKVRLIDVAYGWGIVEMMEATRLGIPLNMQKAKAAAEAVETLIDDLLATGQDPTMSDAANTALGIPGFLNNADIANGAGLANSRVVDLSHWDESTEGQTMLNDLNKLARSVPDGSGQIYFPDTILLPTTEFNLAATTRLNEFDQRTVLQAFLAGNPWVKNIDFWAKCNSVGVDGKNRAVAYKRTSDVVESVIPLDFTQLPPQARNLEFIVPCWARCGGVKVYKPLACRYGDFASS